MKTEREYFEEWASVGGSVMRNIERRDNGLYRINDMQSAWMSWQACAEMKDERLSLERFTAKEVSKEAESRIETLEAMVADRNFLMQQLQDALGSCKNSEAFWRSETAKVNAIINECEMALKEAERQLVCVYQDSEVIHATRMCTNAIRIIKAYRKEGETE